MSEHLVGEESSRSHSLRSHSLGRPPLGAIIAVRPGEDPYSYELSSDKPRL